MDYLLLVIGFVLLIKGADFFVDGSSSIAKRLRVPSIIIGLTIVAMGTSLPETAVSVSASLTGNNELAVSNVVGSNIFNLMVVIGVCGVLATVNVAKETIRRDIPFSLICAGMLLLFGIAGIGDTSSMILGHLDGVIFLGCFAGYIFYMIRTAMKASKEGKQVEIEESFFFFLNFSLKSLRQLRPSLSLPGHPVNQRPYLLQIPVLLPVYDYRQLLHPRYGMARWKVLPGLLQSPGCILHHLLWQDLPDTVLLRRYIRSYRLRSLRHLPPENPSS